MSGIIYLQSVENDLTQDLGSTLIHEAAHARHQDLGLGFSKFWQRSCSISENSGQEVMHAYAAIDYTQQPQREESNVPDCIPEEYFLVAGVAVHFHQTEESRETLGRLYRLLTTLPGRLSDSVERVVIYQDLNKLGVFASLYNPLRHRVTEDIATHTGIFAAAHMYPDEYSNTILQLQNPDTAAGKTLDLMLKGVPKGERRGRVQELRKKSEHGRRRLRILENSRFLDRGTSDILLDPEFVRWYLHRD